MKSEERAINKVSKILSRLEPEVAARVARTAAERFATDAAAEHSEPAGQPPPEPSPHTQGADKRPSFLQTEFRMAVGKELLEKGKSGDESV